MDNDVISYSLIESYKLVPHMNEWDKLILFYNIYIIYSHIGYIHKLLEYTNSCKSNSFYFNFVLTYILFFCVCNIQASYRHGLIKIYQNKPDLAVHIYKNTKEYFLY